MIVCDKCGKTKQKDVDCGIVTVVISMHDASRPPSVPRLAPLQPDVIADLCVHCRSKIMNAVRQMIPERHSFVVVPVPEKRSDCQ